MKSQLFCLLLIFSVLLGCDTSDPEPANQTDNESPAEPDSVDSDTVASDSVFVEPYPDSAYYRAAVSGSLPYQIMFPRNYDQTKKYPLVLFLHGIDERGTDNQKQLRWGAANFQEDSVSKKYPAFVVFPQCPETNRWKDSTMLTQLKSLIDELNAKWPIDSDRIYIDGLSMGAVGTYALVAEYPDMFAAAIAIAGYGEKENAYRMAKVDWKIFAGLKDVVVPATESQVMADALEMSGANVSLIIYPNATHIDTWVNAFAEPDFFSWSFSRRRQ
jgi:predicted peptidase